MNFIDSLFCYAFNWINGFLIPGWNTRVRWFEIVTGYTIGLAALVLICAIWFLGMGN